MASFDGGIFTRLRQDASCGSTGRIGLRQRLRPDKMARDAASCPAEVVTKAEARGAKPGGFGVVALGFATDAPPCERGASLFWEKMY